MLTVKRALLSCYDKTGLEALAKALAGAKVEIVASGGTAEFLAQCGIQVTTVEEFTGATEQLDGRVKTLHPKIHAGILALRERPAHMTTIGEKGLIDLVVVNLYPFQKKIAQTDVAFEEALECIDIGGVALLRAAAKNFKYVAVVSHPSQYAQIIDILHRGCGRIAEPLARQLAVAAFEATTSFDAAVAGFLASVSVQHTKPCVDNEAENIRGLCSAPKILPEEARVQIRKKHSLRYGENPHQRSALYESCAGASWGLSALKQLQGKALSYNNLLDVDMALRSLLDFKETACVIIKHHTPCGLAKGASAAKAYEAAFACDPEAAFGGIVGVNRALDSVLAGELLKSFLEVVVAPEVEPEAERLLSRKPNLRVIRLDLSSVPKGLLEWRQLLGGWLLQDSDASLEKAGDLRIETKRPPSAQEKADLLFAWSVVKHVLSNGIVLARDGMTVGIGQGQPSRVASVRLAIRNAGSRAKGAVAASDGFFPFADSVEELAKAGVAALIEPGGSIRDKEVIKAADTARLAMCLTGVRHFRH